MDSLKIIEPGVFKRKKILDRNKMLVYILYRSIVAELNEAGGKMNYCPGVFYL